MIQLSGHRFLLFLLSSLFVLISCRENAGLETVISGRVYDPVTQLGWANVEVIVIEDRNLSILETALTDAQGRYELSFQTNRNGSLSVAASATNIRFQTGRDATDCGEDNLREVQIGQNQVEDFKIFSMGTLALELINENCLGETDKIEVSWGSGWEACEDISILFEHLGCDPFNPLQDSTVLVPAGLQIFSWTVTRGGLSETFTDSVGIDPEERLEFVLNY